MGDMRAELIDCTALNDGIGHKKQRSKEAKKRRKEEKVINKSVNRTHQCLAG